MNSPAYNLFSHHNQQVRVCVTMFQSTVKHFYTNREHCEVLTGYLSLGRRPGGGWANT